MSLTEAMVEAYAVAPAGETIIETIELDHPSFDEPARIASGIEEDILLPPAEGADPVLFRAVQVQVIPPGMGEDGPTPMRLKLDAVSGWLLPYLRAAMQSTAPVSVTYRAYTTADLTQPGEVIDGLELRHVTLTATAAEGTVSFREIELQAFPLPTYDETYYPALQTV